MNIQSLVRNAIKKSGGIIALAARLGVSRQAIHAWLSGKSVPSGRHVVALISFTERRQKAS